MTYATVSVRITFLAITFLGILPLAQAQQIETMVQDREYMRHLVELNKGRAIQVNLADEQQYRYIMARIAATDKTPENAPYFFESLEQMRVAQMAPGYQGKPESTQLAGSLNEDHFVANISRDDTLPDQFMATTFTTVRNGTAFTYMDSVSFDLAGNQLGVLEWMEEYDVGMHTYLDNTATVEDPATDVVIVESFQYCEGSSGNPYATFISTPMLLGALVNSNLQLSSRCGTNHTVNDPVDKNGDDDAYVCLNASSSACDYPMIHNLGFNVTVPFKGSISLRAFNVSNVSLIWPQPQPQVPDPMTTSLIRLIHPQGGSYYFQPNITNIQSKFDVTFHDPAGQKDDRYNINWDLSRQDGDFGDVRYWQISKGTSRLDWSFQMLVSIDRNQGLSADACYTVGSRYHSPNSSQCLDGDPLKFIWCCVAAGSKIRMADRSLKPIEDIRDGEKVVANGAELTVTHRSIGPEPFPMVRVCDQSGDELLMTQNHPVFTQNRGLVLADNLVMDDLLIKENGPTRITSLTREDYSGLVYNLKLGTSQELQGKTMQVHGLYANGYLVGDLNLELEYAKPETATRAQAKIPLKWKKDYQSYLKRNVAED